MSVQSSDRLSVERLWLACSPVAELLVAARWLACRHRFLLNFPVVALQGPEETARGAGTVYMLAPYLVPQCANAKFACLPRCHEQ